MSIVDRFNKLFGSGMVFNDKLPEMFRIWNTIGRVGLLKTELKDHNVSFKSASLKSIPKNKSYASHKNVFYQLEYIRLTKKLLQPNEYGFYDTSEPILCFARDENIVMIAPVIIEVFEGDTIPLDSLFKKQASSAMVI